MNIQMYEAKSKLSEYVQVAERGEAITICKYNKPAAVLISPEQYDYLQSQKSSKQAVFQKRLELWKDKYGYSVSDNDVDEFVASIEETRHNNKSRNNSFLEDFGANE